MSSPSSTSTGMRFMGTGTTPSSHGPGCYQNERVITCRALSFTKPGASPLRIAAQPTRAANLGRYRRAERARLSAHEQSMNSDARPLAVDYTSGCGASG